MKIPLVNLKAQLAEVESEVRAAIDRVLGSCAFAGGPEVEAFEGRFADYCQADFCIGVGSGTAALTALLRGQELSGGDEVILPVNTFVAAVEAVVLAGGSPVLVDVDEATGNMRPELAAQAVTARTRVVLPTHLYGQPADIAPLMELSEDRRLLVIEDASQAHGARLGSRAVGGLAHAAAFSFYPSKNLGALGDAGCVTTNDPQIARRLRQLREHGASRRQHYELVGGNDRMDGLQAAALSVMLNRLDVWNERRRAIADRYRTALSQCDRVRPFDELPGRESVYHQFVVRVPDRDRIRDGLLERGVETAVHYATPLHLQPAYSHLGYGPGDFPVAEELCRQVLSLPIYPQLHSEQVDYVCRQLLELV